MINRYYWFDLIGVINAFKTYVKSLHFASNLIENITNKVVQNRFTLNKIYLIIASKMVLFLSGQ